MRILQFSYHPVVKRSVILEFQSTDGMSDPFNSVLDGMREIIHGINTPFVPCIVMRHMGHTIDHRVTHIHIRGSHIDLCAEYFLPVLIFSFFHLFKKAEVLFHAAVPVRALLARLGKSAAVLTDLVRRQIADICFALFDQFYRRLIHLVKIVGRKKQTVFPVRSQPADILQDGINELCLLFGRIRIVETHVEFTVIFLCKPVVQKYGLRVSDMEIAVGFRRKTCMHGVVNTLGQVFVNNILNKIFGNGFVLHLFPSCIILKKALDKSRAFLS